MNGWVFQDENLCGWEREVDLEGEMTTERLKPTQESLCTSQIKKRRICCWMQDMQKG